MPEIGQGEDTIERLIVETRSSNALERLRAAQQLGAAGDTRAVVPLTALLQDPAREVVEAALTSLGNLGDPRVVEAIAAVFSDRDMMATMGRADAISTAAAEALRKLGEPGFQALIRLLHEHFKSEFEGLALVLALGKVADPRALEALTVALHSPVWEVNRAAAYALAKFGEVTVPVLVAALESPNGWVAYHARGALSQFGATPLPSLLELFYTSETGGVRAEAVQAIAAIDDPHVPDILRSALVDTNQEVRHVAVKELGKRRDPNVLEQLLDLPVPAMGGQDLAVGIISEYGPEVAVLLLDVLQDRERSPETRARAAAVLAGLEIEDAVPPLISALREDDERVCRAAATSLGQLGDTQAIEPLLEAFATGTPGVRGAVMGALLHFDDPRAFDAIAAVARNPHENRKLRIAVIVYPRFNHKSGALPVLRQLALAAHGDPRENLDTYSPALAALGPLSRLGRPGIQTAIEVAQSTETSLCLHALRQLQQSGIQLDNDAVEQVAALLCDPRTAVRYQAAIVLGARGDPRAIEPLIEALRHPDVRGKQEAARALEKVGDERAVLALDQALAEGWNTDLAHRPHPSFEFEVRDTIQCAILTIRARQQEQAAQTARAESES
jgi:HEAT repeat protein